MSSMSPSGWMLALVLSLLFSVLIGLALIWFSIERTDKAYSIRQLQSGLVERTILKSKLEVERERLLAPHLLRQKAAALGMTEARFGQIRRMPEPNIQKNR